MSTNPLAGTDLTAFPCLQSSKLGHYPSLLDASPPPYDLEHVIYISDPKFPYLQSGDNESAYLNMGCGDLNKAKPVNISHKL